MVDKGSAVVVWDRDDYLKEAKTQLDDKNVYKELTGDVEGPLEKVIKTVILLFYALQMLWTYNQISRMMKA